MLQIEVLIETIMFVINKKKFKGWSGPTYNENKISFFRPTLNTTLKGKPSIENPAIAIIQIFRFAHIESNTVFKGFISFTYIAWH